MSISVKWLGRAITLIILAAALSACGSTTEPQAAVQSAVAVATSAPTAVATPAPLPPAIVQLVPTADTRGSVKLPSADELATIDPCADGVCVTPSITPQPSATITPTPSPTPPPTFTPPALPGTSPNEHYWLWRPIQDGGTVWTNKHYSFASTRSGTLRIHRGVEFDVGHNTPVLASAGGTVTFAGSDIDTLIGPRKDFYGNVIVIEHETQYKNTPVFTVYAHLNEVFVATGQRVDAKNIIGLSGATGVAEGAHLHFEVRLGVNDYDHTQSPLLWLYPFSEHGTIAGRVIWPDGSLVYEVGISANRIDAPSPYRAATSYAVGDINPDDGWQENFVLDDVPAGYYEIVVTQGKKKHKVEAWVYEYGTTFVEIVIDASTEPTPQP